MIAPAETTTYRVFLAPLLVDTMVLAAAEAYCFGNTAQKRTYVETIGYVWGLRRTEMRGTERQTVIFLDTCSVSSSAERKRNSVFPNLKALSLKQHLMHCSAPWLTLLGDFHSHPYASLEEVKAAAGFEFSENDFQDFLRTDELWKSSDDNPVMLAVTICKLDRIRSTHAQFERKHILKFAIGEYQFWIGCAVGYLDKNGNRAHTRNKNERRVTLEMRELMFNASDNRVGSI